MDKSKVAEKTVGGVDFMEIGDDDDCPLKDLTDDAKEEEVFKLGKSR